MARPFLSHDDVAQQLAEKTLEIQRLKEMLAAHGVIFEKKEKEDDETIKVTQQMSELDVTDAASALAGGHQRMLEKLTCLMPEEFTYPTCEIKLTNLSYTVTGETYARGGKENLITPLTRLPCLRLCNPPTAVAKRVLSGVNLSIKPGSLTLILGAPGCGKSSLLKAVAGLLKKDGKHVVEGDVSYDDITVSGNVKPDFFVSKVVRYTSQRDEHIPTLTVDETMRFAHTCATGGKGPLAIHQATSAASGSAVFPDSDKLSAATDLFVDVTQANLGLSRVKDTIVGNASVRGVSGGERRRVTSGEVLVTVGLVHCMDEISTGLDSAATLDIVTNCREVARATGTSYVMSLLQPSPDVFAQFDQVVLLEQGHVAFAGPRDQVLPYLSGLGFARPPAMDVADYLQEVCGEMGGHFYDASAGAPPAPKGGLQWSEAFRTSQTYKDGLTADAAHPMKEAVWAGFARQEFQLSWGEYVKQLLLRELKVMRRDKMTGRARVIQGLVMGLVVGSLFFNLAPNDFQSRFGLFFNAMMISSMGSMPMLPNLVRNRSIFYRQRDAGMFPTSAFTMASTIAELPVILLGTFLMTTLQFWMAGLADSENYIRWPAFSFICISAAAAMSATLRVISSVARDPGQAQLFAAVLVFTLVIFSGFVINEDSIPEYWLWLFQTNPLSYTYRALVLNEFKSDFYQNRECQVGGGQTAPCGDVYLRAYGFTTDEGQIWVSLLFLWCWIVGMNVVQTVAMHFLRVSPEPPIEVGEATATERSAKELARLRPILAGMRKAKKAAVKRIRPAADADVELTEKKGEAVVADADVELTEKPTAAAAGGVEYEKGSTGLEEVDLEAGPAQQGAASSSALPFTPVTLSWHELRYSVDLPKKKRTRRGEEDSAPNRLELLGGVSGFSKAGTMTALMGSSGAGKTTLMDVLAGRKTGGYITGDILVNGHPKDTATFARVSGYVEQLDVHETSTTVREALEFSAALRLPGPAEVPEETRAAFVDEVVALVGMEEEGDVLVADLSNEQRKRLTIAVELVANPSVLFLDEPTSGLDAHAALTVMEGVRNIAASGRSVVCTVHQPSFALFRMFDALLLLQKGGQTVFFGELGEDGVNVVRYLERVPGSPRMAEGTNPADFMLVCIGAGTAAGASLAVTTRTNYAEAYRASSLRASAEQELQSMRGLAESCSPLSFATVFARDKAAQMKVVMTRRLRAYWRNPAFNTSRLVVALLLGLLFGTVWIDSKLRTTEEVGSIAGLLFMMQVFIGVINLLPAIPLMAEERDVFYRERASAMYQPGVYFGAVGCVELPYLALISLVFANVSYWLIGLSSDAAAFWMFQLFIMQMVTMYTVLGQMLAVVMPTMQLAGTLGSLLINLWTLVSGFLIPYDEMPDVFKVLYWLSPSRYVFEGLVTTQFNGKTGLVTTPFGQTETVEDLVKIMFPDMNYDNRWNMVAALCVFIVGFRGITLYALRNINHQKR